MENRERHLAKEFTLCTNKSIFLTGKAGTGKTTLLREIIKETTKNTVVVAPTGVAAINANGMTIHSMFQLPTSAFIPTNDASVGNEVINKIDLIAQQRMRVERRKVLESLELLIIDEISMVRADLLDAIDIVLKKYRRNSDPFGGVQLLVIGDLSQLSPVVRPTEWHVLQRYYESAYFFNSLAWKQLGAITIELKKIYRQNEGLFVEILNRIRLGEKSKQDIDILNKRLHADIGAEDIITLTTHNAIADQINNKALTDLPGNISEFEASVTGTFYENSYPMSTSLKIKIGAQVMFLKNDTEGRYFNGKLGVVKQIIDNKIIITSDEQDIAIEKIEWQNIRYEADQNNGKLKQNIIGTFSHYPIKLAWAVTVHKSQGLTFDKVILDLENTFAPGQLYVALSRCRSLEGIKLISPIQLDSVIVDSKVTAYYENHTMPSEINVLLKKEKERYDFLQVVKLWDFTPISADMEEWREDLAARQLPNKVKISRLSKSMLSTIEKYQDINSTFQKQLTLLYEEKQNEKIIERLCKGIDYMTTQLHDAIIVPLNEHISEYKPIKNTKKYIRFLRTLENTCWRIINNLYEMTLKDKKVYNGEIKYKRVKLFDPDKKGSSSSGQIKGETYRITLDLLNEGNTIEAVATKRDMALSTIEGHVSKLIKEGKVDIHSFLEKNIIQPIEEAMKSNPEMNLTDIKLHLKDVYDYSTLRMVQSYLYYEQNKA